MPSFSRPGFPGLFVLTLALMGLAGPIASAAAAPVIGLFTDYGWDDPYVAQLKGAVLTIDPEARLLDLTHTVTPFNVVEGAYLLDQSAEPFPAGTIFVAVVDPQIGIERDPVLIQTTKGKFYLGPDNGLFTAVIAREGLTKAWKLDRPQFFRAGDSTHVSHGRDIFGPVAAHLAMGTSPEKLGTPMKSVLSLPDREPSYNAGLISAQVVHIDRFGNVILNLSASSEVAAKMKEGTLVRISVGKESYSAPLVKTYGDVEKGRLMLVYGGNSLLEISVNQGSAARQLKLVPGASIYLKP